MKFGDKLIELRKKNGYSQEELAEKLGVSRQSVSKWENNTTYPETDKIIQIANLFECSMDDLINDKITDIESSLRKNKNNINMIWESLLEFIRKTINMNSKMTFKEGCKCTIEMLGLTFMLYILGLIICNSASSIISNIFNFLRPEIVSKIREILKNILYLIWFIFSLITIVQAFKIRYLNNYDNEIEENIPKNKLEKEENNNNNNIYNKKYEKSFKFIECLSKILIICIKFIVFWIFLGIVFSTITLIIFDILLIYHIQVHLIFLWISLLSLATTIIMIQIIILLINFLLNKKNNIKINIIIFITAITLIGISIGMATLSAKNIEYKDNPIDFDISEQSINIKYRDNLVIETTEYNEGNYKYIIDNNMTDDEIIVSKKINKTLYELNVYKTSMDNLPVIIIEEISNVENIKEIYNTFINNLKENKIYSYSSAENESLEIKANENTINKLINNLKKLYLIEEQQHDNEINITTKIEKVHFRNGLLGEYNGIDDTIKYSVDNYSCIKEIENTEYGERIIYNCNYKEKED